MQRVSIIVPAYNAEKTLAQCLEACQRQTYPDVEIIVVDDGSTDNTPSIAQSFGIHCFRQENQGPAAARNRGAGEACGDILAFTDADCVPAVDWVERLVEGFGEGIVAVGGTYGIVNSGSLLARMIHEEIQIRHEKFGEEVDFVGSFNMAVLAASFRNVGGFDSRFPAASAEDNDLSYRLQDVGGNLCFQRNAVVAHHHPARLWGYLRTQARHGYWRMKLYAKHPNRARKGDRYAGCFDLMAPPMAFVSLVGLIGLGLFRRWTVVARASLVLLIAGTLYLLMLHGQMATRMVKRTGDRRMLWYCLVGILRDFARALGMVAGVVKFWFLKREEV